jgi:hypothetical protein
MRKFSDRQPKYSFGAEQDTDDDAALISMVTLIVADYLGFITR